MKPQNLLTQIDDTFIYYQKIGPLPFNPNLISRAKNLRKAGNFSEVVFWLHVKNKLFYKIDFDRQKVIGNYIVDFYIKSLGLIIEIDGTSHNEKEKYDLRRENYLKNLGLKIFRITDNRIKLDLNNVLEELKDYIKLEYGTYSPPLECDCL